MYLSRWVYMSCLSVRIMHRRSWKSVEPFVVGGNVTDASEWYGMILSITSVCPRGETRTFGCHFVLYLSCVYYLHAWHVICSAMLCSMPASNDLMSRCSFSRSFIHPPTMSDARHTMFSAQTNMTSVSTSYRVALTCSHNTTPSIICLVDHTIQEVQPINSAAQTV